MDRKTLDWEIVELTNKLLDAKTTINKLEELNVSESAEGCASVVRCGLVLWFKVMGVEEHGDDFSVYEGGGAARSGRDRQTEKRPEGLGKEGLICTADEDQTPLVSELKV